MVKTMKKKVIILIILLVVLVLLLMSYKWVIYSNYVMKKTGHSLITALEKHDQNAIRALFSTKALKDATDFEEGMTYLMDICDGSVLEYVDGGFHDSISVIDGKKYASFNKIYILTLETGEYNMFFQYKTGPTKVEKGLYSLGVVERNKKGDSEYSSGRAGIYHPGWD